MSELSKQASITFVENILHSGKNNNRTTEAAREVHEERMKAYANMLTSDLLQEARKKLNTIRKCENRGPLTAKDIYPKAWEARKLNSNTSSMIHSLKAANLNCCGKLPPKAHHNWKTRGHSGRLSLQNSEQLERFHLLCNLQLLRYGVMDRNFQHMTYQDNASSSYKTCQTLYSL